MLTGAHVSRSVTITDHGRDGSVRYSDGARGINGHFEFGGGDVVTIISMGSADEWRQAQDWASPDRAAILRFVADEVIRQRAPSCAAEIDAARGVILLRQIPGAKLPPTPAQRNAKAAAFVHRFRDLKSKLAGGVLVATLVVGALMWFGANAVTAQPGSGVPLNEAVRFASEEPALRDGVASLIQSADPTGPRWTGRGNANDTASISVALIPVDGSRPRVIPVAKNLTHNAYVLARIIGSDGQTLWLDVAGLHGVRLRDFKLVGPQDLQTANPTLDRSWWDDPRGMDVVDGALHIVRIDRSAALTVNPADLRATPTTPVSSNARFERRGPANHLAAGLRVGRDAWLGLHSSADLAGDYRAGRWIKPVQNAEEKASLRRLYRARLGDAAEGGRRRIDAMTPLGDGEYYGAAFLRMDAKSEPLRLQNPDSGLMIHTSAPGLAGTLVVSRVDAQGNVVWSVDTALDRFRLQQILPGENVLAFIGPRLPEPDKLSEPFVVLVETQTGKVTAQSLWR